MTAILGRTYTLHARPYRVLTEMGALAALECGGFDSMRERPRARDVLNVIGKAHLIPLVDGGIPGRVDGHGRPLHADWRIQTIGPEGRFPAVSAALPEATLPSTWQADLTRAALAITKR